MTQSINPDGERVSVQPFGTAPGGQPVLLYALTNANGLVVRIMDFGATVVDLVVPDRDGHWDDVSLGFEDFGLYLTQSPYFGSTIGRYGNRIAQGRFSLGGKTYLLAKNNGPNSLHGGSYGFDKKSWQGRILPGELAAVEFSYLSPDGEEGYPGNLAIKVTFTLTEENELKINYEAVTDQATVVNLTNHTYFNLAGAGRSTILDHELTIHADYFTPVDETLIPTGEIRSVEGTPLDFRTSTKIGARFEMLGVEPKGYDHNYVLRSSADKLPLIAEVYEPKSGRTLQVLTDMPGVQFYSGNFLDETVVGKGGRAYRQHAAFCLETQYYPDSPNHPNFPSTIIQPGHPFQSQTIYRFGVRGESS